MHQTGSSTNHLFYVSTPAAVAAPIIEGLGLAGLSRNVRGWSRIVLERPFGHDLNSDDSSTKPSYARLIVSSGNSDPLDSGNSGTPKNLQKG
jgi:Glucose-6-phosphate dehydrogenase, NAD binding domain